MISIGEQQRQASLPDALKGLPELFLHPIPKEPRSLCTLHGPMSGGECTECDKHFPEVVEARKIKTAPAAVGGLSIEDVLKNPIVAKMIQDAVNESVEFNLWKKSQAGQAAAASSITAQAAPEDKEAATGGADAKDQLIADLQRQLDEAKAQGGQQQGS